MYSLSRQSLLPGSALSVCTGDCTCRVHTSSSLHFLQPRGPKYAIPYTASLLHMQT